MDAGRAQALIDCFERGLGVRATARETGAARSTVARWHRRWHAAKPGAVLAVGVRGPSLARLAIHAGARSLSPAQLTAQLVDAITDYDLVDVILADRDAIASAGTARPSAD